MSNNYSQHLLSLNIVTHDLTDIIDIILSILSGYAFIMSSKHSYTHYHPICVVVSRTLHWFMR